MNETVKAVFDRVDALASTLHTTAGQLMEIYTRQAYVQGVVDLALGGLLLAGTGGSLLVARYWKRKIDAYTKDQRNSYYPDSWDFGMIAPVVLAGLLTLLGVISLAGGVQEVVNPTFWAVKHLAGDLLTGGK